jgi:uncharacterized protein (DUF362 family)
MLALDAKHYGTPEWNPLGELIRPGDRVVLKPNLVSHRNLGECAYGISDTTCLITHGSVIRAVADYAGKALQGSGSVLIADCPLQGTDWDAVVEIAGLNSVTAQLRRTFPGVDFAVRDFRLGHAVIRDGSVIRRTTAPNKSACTEIDLGGASRLEEISKGCSFGIAQYGRTRMERAHGVGRHRYLIPNDILNADVFLNLPKVKTHMKAGYTCALKNLVGINAHKDYLPHFRHGGPHTNGDEYPDGSMLWDIMWSLFHSDWDRERGAAKGICRNAARLCSRILRLAGYPKWAGELGGGSWAGNDTLWRTVLDINAALFYFDPASGQLGHEPRRDLRYMTIADGLIGGEREGPLAPTPAPSGFMAAAMNPVALDAVIGSLMGFDVIQLRQIVGAFDRNPLPLANFALDDIRVLGLGGVRDLSDIDQLDGFHQFVPSHGFIGRIERKSNGCTLHDSECATDVWKYFSRQSKAQIRT